MNNYAGIDYSRGMANVNYKTGIHYGVINQNKVGESWFESSEADYGMPGCSKCGYEFKKSKSPTKCPNCGYRPNDDSEFYREDPIEFYYNQDGYKIIQSGDDTDLFILKSPYFTYCQFCSPCAPGAGYIMNSVNPEHGGIKTYCLGHDWFESQETGNWIDCKYCNGTGYRKITEIPHFNKESFIANGGMMHGDDKVYCWNCNRDPQMANAGKIKERINKAPYPVYSVKTGKLVEPTIDN
jgi:DNA-directed RNA polymerase subunit RPC12/RpoP